MTHSARIIRDAAGSLRRSWRIGRDDPDLPARIGESHLVPFLLNAYRRRSRGSFALPTLLASFTGNFESATGERTEERIAAWSNLWTVRAVLDG